MHILYQLQVVLGNVDVRVAPTRPQKWPTYTTMTMTPIWKNHSLFYMFTLKTFSIGSYQGLIKFISKLKGQKTTYWSHSLAKPLKPKPPLQNQPYIELSSIVFFLI